MIYLIVTNIVLFGFLVYRDWAHRKDMERKDDLIQDLNLKFMSRDTDDYIRAKAPKPENMESTVDDLIPVEEISDAQFYGAEDKL